MCPSVKRYRLIPLTLLSGQTLRPRGRQALPNLTRVKSRKKQQGIGKRWKGWQSLSPLIVRTVCESRVPEGRLSNLPVAD